MRCLTSALLAGALMAVPVVGGAADWSLVGSVGQFFEANTNPGVDVDNDGATYGASTRLNLSLGARTNRTTWSLSSGASLSRFGGPGATSDLNTPNPNARGAVRYSGKRFDLGASVGFSRASTSFLEFNTEAIIAAIEAEGDDFDGIIILPEDDLLIERSSVRTLYNFNADTRYRLSPRNSFLFSGSGAISRFSENVGGLTDNSSLGFAVGFEHNLDPLSSVGLNLRLRQFTADNAEETLGRSIGFSTSYRTQLTRSTSLSASLGGGYNRIREFEIVDGERVADVDTDFTVTGGLRASYRSARDTQISFGATHAVRPSSDGDLRNVTAFNGAMNYNLTPLASVSVAAGHSISSELGNSGNNDLEHSFVFGPTLSYRFASAWSASLGYTFRFVDDESGTAVGNRVFLGVSRSLQFFP